MWTLPSLPFVGPVRFPEILRKHFTGRDASNEKGAHVPVEGGMTSSALERGGIADCDGLHAMAGIAAADDPPLSIERGDAILQSLVSWR